MEIELRLGRSSSLSQESGLAKFEVKLEKKCVKELTITIEAETRSAAAEEAIKFAENPLIARKPWGLHDEHGVRVVSVRVKS